MLSCLHAIKTLRTRHGSGVITVECLFLLALLFVLFSPQYSFAQEVDSVTDEQCQQAWPVSCEQGAEGDTGCGGWNIVADLAEPELLPESEEETCSTGARISMGADSQGQPVGSMFHGQVIFSQAGRGRCAGSCPTGSKTVLKRIPIYVHDIAIAGLVVSIMLMKTEAGLNAGQPQNLSLIQVGIGFLNSPSRNPDSGGIATNHCQRAG